MRVNDVCLNNIVRWKDANRVRWMDEVRGSGVIRERQGVRKMDEVRVGRPRERGRPCVTGGRGEWEGGRKAQYRGDDAEQTEEKYV